MSTFTSTHVHTLHKLKVHKKQSSGRNLTDGDDSDSDETNVHELDTADAPFSPPIQQQANTPASSMPVLYVSYQ